MKKMFFAAFMAVSLLVSCKSEAGLPSFLENAAYVDIDVFSSQYKEGKIEWDSAFAFLSSPSLDTMQVKVWHQLADGTRARTNKIVTKETNIFEVHHKIVDVFYVIDGAIKVGVSAPSALVDCRKPYNEEKDVEIYGDSSDKKYVVVGKGQFIVLFPSDAHSPNLCVDVPAEAHVAVVKVPYFGE